MPRPTGGVVPLYLPRVTPCYYTFRSFLCTTDCHWHRTLGLHAWGVLPIHFDQPLPIRIASEYSHLSTVSRGHSGVVSHTAVVEPAVCQGWRGGVVCGRMKGVKGVQMQHQYGWSASAAGHCPTVTLVPWPHCDRPKPSRRPTSQHVTGSLRQPSGEQQAPQVSRHSPAPRQRHLGVAFETCRSCVRRARACRGHTIPLLTSHVQQTDTHCDDARVGMLEACHHGHSRRWGLGVSVTDA